MDSQVDEKSLHPGFPSVLPLKRDFTPSGEKLFPFFFNQMSLREEIYSAFLAEVTSCQRLHFYAPNAAVADTVGAVLLTGFGPLWVANQANGTGGPTRYINYRLYNFLAWGNENTVRISDAVNTYPLAVDWIDDYCSNLYRDERNRPLFAQCIFWPFVVGGATAPGANVTLRDAFNYIKHHVDSWFNNNQPTGPTVYLPEFDASVPDEESYSESLWKNSRYFHQDYIAGLGVFIPDGFAIDDDATGRLVEFLDNRIDYLVIKQVAFFPQSGRDIDPVQGAIQSGIEDWGEIPVLGALPQITKGAVGIPGYLWPALLGFGRADVPKYPTQNAYEQDYHRIMNTPGSLSFGMFKKLDNMSRRVQIIVDSRAIEQMTERDYPIVPDPRKRR